jgi:hypothetical protein
MGVLLQTPVFDVKSASRLHGWIIWLDKRRKWGEQGFTAIWLSPAL